MNRQEFRDLVQQQTDLELLGPCLQEDLVPYVFDPRPESWTIFREELSARLGASSTDIRIVGSARLGFSLKPGRDLAPFQDTSDIDVVVVNADLFDALWFSLLKAAYPRPPMLQKVGGWIEARRNEVYTGWLSPLDVRLDARIIGEKARPVLQFNVRWFTALKEASQYPPRRHEDVKGRLYRTLYHAEIYHLNSLAALRKSLKQQEDL